MLGRVDRWIEAVVDTAKWLALPIALCLFLQWPLRDWVQHFSRETNDLGQVLFALYVAASVTAATRRGTHLAVDALARTYPAGRRRILTRCGAALGLIPWALFVLFAGRNVVWSSILLREDFPDTGNPGYFVLKAALWLLGLLMLGQGLLDLAHPRERSPAS